VVTGNPIRAEISALDPARDKAAAKRSFGVDEGRRLLLVVGGSLGATKINQAVVAALPLWTDRADLTVHHVVGRRDWAAISAGQATISTGALERRAVEYEDDMPGALAAADLVVCRAGSSTCFELAAASLPAILVPSPSVTADQQTSNAEHLVSAGAAVLVRDAELDGARLADEVDALLADPDRMAVMGEAARQWARPNAAADIAALAGVHARG
jgi:UDP-N-acetylglucosamine--N-acetylmuramyl-(pentapeptide) pyrophosphoryl-undecaprenol N-acetylglucosamine transferase